MVSYVFLWKSHNANLVWIPTILSNKSTPNCLIQPLISKTLAYSDWPEWFFLRPRVCWNNPPYFWWFWEFLQKVLHWCEYNGNHWDLHKSEKIARANQCQYDSQFCGGRQILTLTFRFLRKPKSCCEDLRLIQRNLARFAILPYAISRFCRATQWMWGKQNWVSSFISGIICNLFC